MNERLEIELVPRTAWWTNVRSNVTKAEWERCKRFVRDRSGNRCEICGGRGRKWAVECHEIWDYDDERQIQTLVGLIALCPRCHQAKHLGRSEVVLPDEQVTNLYAHICDVNKWPIEKFLYYRDIIFKVWALRSEHEWDLDVSWLSLLGIEPRVNDRREHP